MTTNETPSQLFEEEIESIKTILYEAGMFIDRVKKIENLHPTAMSVLEFILKERLFKIL